jgi:2-desacetyl-2-hydroxyethyl bacteriochlorophyllide A dehydrogenase
MKAAVLTGAGEITMAADWPAPECGSSDVIVAMEALGICGSDLSAYDGRHPEGYPRILGHEGVGRVLSCGSDVNADIVGKRVVIEPNVPCLKCSACRSGRTSACPDRIIIGGGNRSGLLAEYVAVPREFVWPVPDDLPATAAACIEPLAVAQTALHRIAPGPSDTCLVIGAGSLGLLACLAIHALGAFPVVVDVQPERQRRAQSLGAKSLEEITTPVTHVLETTGYPEVLNKYLDRIANAADIALVGISNGHIGLDYRTVVRRQLTLHGSLIYDHPGGFPRAIESVTSGTVDPARTVDAQFPFDDTATAFARARKMGGKSIILF